ncbi:RING1 and YY1-binding protein A-like [Contarinia nasturtii]|uniref:RING1 and YY1-binding protein A-like n=1 Tax=Contarinia nasturtii TaxID=265458 RepID=UPI0012D46DB2|nr:RING1 and YY1-binding protein A-like [Contarinia nasturtii]
MYKIFTIFIAVIITSCLAQRPLRFRNKRIPYEDDDYRDNNGDFDDDRPNEINNLRPYDHHGGNRFNQMHDMNRQTQFDVGGGRDPPLDYSGFRAYNQRPLLNPLQPQQLQQQQPQQLQQPQQNQQPQQIQQQPQPYEAGGRVGAFGYNPYGQYTYNPYGYRPGYYGWNRPSQSVDPWRNSYGLGFPFNLLGLGGGSSSAYRPWWSSNRFPFGLF